MCRVPRFTKVNCVHRQRVIVTLAKVWESVSASLWNSVSQWPARAPNRTTLFSLFQTNYDSNHQSLLNVLLETRASIPQIYQSIFKINWAEIVVPSTLRQMQNCLHMSCALRRKVPGCVPADIRVEVLRAVWSKHWRQCGLIDKSNCRDVGRAPVPKLHTVFCHRSGQHYLKYGGPPYILVAHTGQWMINCTGPNWSGGLKSAPGQQASAYVEGCR